MARLGDASPSATPRSRLNCGHEPVRRAAEMVRRRRRCRTAEWQEGPRMSDTAAHSPAVGSSSPSLSAVGARETAPRNQTARTRRHRRPRRRRPRRHRVSRRARVPQSQARGSHRRPPRSCRARWSRRAAATLRARSTTTSCATKCRGIAAVSTSGRHSTAGRRRLGSTSKGACAKLVTLAPRAPQGSSARSRPPVFDVGEQLLGYAQRIDVAGVLVVRATARKRVSRRRLSRPCAPRRGRARA
jgi:hypothetical protein